ncbi:MAG: T9SS type A sorting domain-containing protein [Flavobacteriales bacterium]
MPWSAEYAYTVSDACGNTTTFSYTVEGDESNAGGAYVSGEESGHQPFDISVIGGIKEPIRITGLAPNPTNDVSQLGFVVSENMRLRVDLYTMSGNLVQELYEGNAVTGVQYVMDIDADALSDGMYQVRISSNSYLAVKKLLVAN